MNYEPKPSREWYPPEGGSHVPGKGETGLRPITLDEWRRWDWVEVTTMGEDPDVPVFLRGREKVGPPDDGYVYVNRTRWEDDKTRWVRAMTPTKVQPDIGLRMLRRR